MISPFSPEGPIAIGRSTPTGSIQPTAYDADGLAAYIAEIVPMKLRRHPKLLVLIDLFCGAGGSSTGAIEALQSLGYEVLLIAINHWDVAISTHWHNLPNGVHFCPPT